MDDKIVDVLKDKEEDTSIQRHLIYSRCLLLTSWRIHGADGRRDKFHTKSGLTRLKKGSPFRHQTIEFGISMTKIVPKEPRETNKHAKGSPEIERAILCREATSPADSSVTQAQKFLWIALSDPRNSEKNSAQAQVRSPQTLSESNRWQWDLGMTQLQFRNWMEQRRIGHT